MRRQDPRQNKALSQVFLRDSWPCQRIAAQCTKEGVERVLEIGPGGGILTRELLAQGLDVTAVEHDSRFAEILNDKVGVELATKLTVVNQDVLFYDLGEWIEAQSSRAAVAGNIPYHISAPIIMWVIGQIDRLANVQLMVQKEFAERLVAKPGSKAYGSLSVYVQLRCQVELAFVVERSLFTPIPKVDSAVVVFKPLEKVTLSLTELSIIEMIARVSFAQRRKKLRTSIRHLIGRDKEASCPIDLNRRPETLTPAEFISLAAYYSVW
jgi:16S rRNA (adenine1518-N6/adenine1519-N6)-dimethyltransferase